MQFRTHRFAKAFAALCSFLASLVLLPALGLAQATDPLPSWNEGAAKTAIIEFVQATTDTASPKFVAPEDRIAEFDQDGTLWVEHPLYTQFAYCLDRVGVLAKEKPELKDREPFKTVLSGDREAIEKLSDKDLFEIVLTTQSGMTVEAFEAEVKTWLATARDPRWNHPYTELIYQPMLEVLHYFRANGYQTFIATGGSANFVRVYSEQVYGIPPQQVSGTSQPAKYGYEKDQRPILSWEPKLVLDNLGAGKIENFWVMYGRRPNAASAILPATTGRCSNTPRQAPARGCRCWCCTTMTSANTPTDRRRGCPTPRSAPSRRNSTTRRRRMAGSSSA